MQYLRIENIKPGMTLAKSIVGDNGSLLVKAQNMISETVLRRMTGMGFQGAYIDVPIYSDIIVNDVIPDEIRASAFDALKNGDFMGCVPIAKKMVQELKYKEMLKMDLLDIKNDKNYLYKHSVSVAVFATVVGVGLDLTVEQLENLAVAGLLHDIGKLDVKKKVLNAKHIYNDREMDEMKKHPMNSYEMLKDYPNISSVTRNSILFHHENLDGTGYYHIAGEKLGLFPRILRVVDAYDAMTAQRSYRKAESPADAIEYIMANVGNIFDKEVVDVFVKKFPVYPIGFTVKLSNSQDAVVVSNEKNAMRPLIRFGNGTDVDLSENPDYRTILIEGME